MGPGPYDLTPPTAPEGLLFPMPLKRSKVLFSHTLWHGRSEDFGLGGTLFGVGLVGGGVRGRSPSWAGEFSKIIKKFLNKIAKNALF